MLLISYISDDTIDQHTDIIHFILFQSILSYKSLISRNETLTANKHIQLNTKMLTAIVVGGSQLHTNTSAWWCLRWNAETQLVNVHGLWAQWAACTMAVSIENILTQITLFA